MGPLFDALQHGCCLWSVHIFLFKFTFKAQPTCVSTLFPKPDLISASCFIYMSRKQKACIHVSQTKGVYTVAMILVNCIDVRQVGY